MAQAPQPLSSLVHVGSLHGNKARYILHGSHFNWIFLALFAGAGAGISSVAHGPMRVLPFFIFTLPSLFFIRWQGVDVHLDEPERRVVAWRWLFVRYSSKTFYPSVVHAAETTWTTSTESSSRTHQGSRLFIDGLLIGDKLRGDKGFHIAEEIMDLMRRSGPGHPVA